MTVLIAAPTTCAVCATTREVALLAPRSPSDDPDLDGRGQGGALGNGLFVQRCDACGYAAPRLDDLGDAPRDQVRALLAADERRALDARADLPPDARTLLRAGWLREQLGDPRQAARAALSAAWACEEAGNAAGAAECRQLAFERFRAARSADRASEHSGPHAELMLADLARRLGRFDDARAHAAAALAADPPASLAALARYQHALADWGTLERYTVTEARGGRSPDEVVWRRRLAGVLVGAGCLGVVGLPLGVQLLVQGRVPLGLACLAVSAAPVWVPLLVRALLGRRTRAFRRALK